MYPFLFIGAFGSSDRVRLEDVKALTLYNGKMTTGRRSSPVPQVKQALRN